MLRPTDSPTLFLQQLGRGLRRSTSKTVCTVLDFVGRHRTEFRFDHRFRALLGGSRRELIRQVEQGFPFLPAGCHLQLDRVVAGIVLDSLRKSIPSGWTAKVEELRAQSDRDGPVTLVASMTDRAIEKSTTLAEAWELLRSHPQVCSELLELFTVLGDRIDHLHEPLRTHPQVPLQIHARYTRIEILAAFGVGKNAKVSPWQTGCYWAAEAAADLFAFTLDKTRGQFSPTTRYRDYAVSRELIHWESQSRTRVNDETGQRYIRQRERGTSVMLFARLRSDERAFWFLGPAAYVSHESEQPIAITWRLEVPLPGDLFAAFAAAVA